MRLFAGDHFPRLAVQSGDLPRPWVMPSGLPRAHRDRLAVLLAQALRALEPDLRLVQLRWAERHALLSGRINLPSSVLVWWRIDAVPVVDPQAVILDGSKMTPGLALYDFDQEVSLPAEAWLGPLKMGVLHRILDRLLDERPVGGYEEIADAVREISAKLISPIDLVDAAETMVEVEAQGEGLDSAKAEAIGRIVAGRFTTGAVESAVRALVAAGRDEALGDKEHKALREAGLADPGEVVPVLDLMQNEEILRRALLHIVAQRRFEGSVAELAPGLFPEERLPSVKAGVDLVPPQTLSPLDDGSPGLYEPQAQSVRQAMELIDRGDDETGSRLLLRALQQREDSAWISDDVRAAGLLLLQTAMRENRLGNMDRASLERLSALYDAASGLLERSGEASESAVAALHGAGFARAMLRRWEGAAALFERGRALAASSGQRFYLALCLSSLSRTMLNMGRAREAMALAEEAVELFRALGMRGSEGGALMTIGDARMEIHQAEGARSAYNQALAALSDAEEPVPLTKAAILLSLGRLWQFEGNSKNARQAFEDALSLFREHKSRLNEAVAHEALGELSLSRNEPLRAREAFEEAVPLYHEYGDRLGELRALARLGDAHVSMNALARARDAYDAALELAREIGDHTWEALLLFKCAGVRERGGDYDSALREYEEALRLYETVGDRVAQARTMKALGDVEWRPERRPGGLDKALRWYDLAVARFRETDDAVGLTESLCSLGVALYFKKRRQQARRAVAEALDVARANGNEALIAHAKTLNDDMLE